MESLCRLGRKHREQMHGISETSMYLYTDRFICFEGGTRIKVKRCFSLGHISGIRVTTFFYDFKDVMISDKFLDFQLRPQSPEALHSTQFSHLMKHSSWLSWQHPHTPHMNYTSFFWLEVFTWGLLGVCKFFYWNIPLEGHWIGIYQAFFEIIVYESR